MNSVRADIATMNATLGKMTPLIENICTELKEKETSGGKTVLNAVDIVCTNTPQSHKPPHHQRPNIYLWVLLMLTDTYIIMVSDAKYWSLTL